MKIISFTEEGRKIASSLADMLSGVHGFGENEKLVLVTPHTPASANERWQKIHRIWKCLSSSGNSSEISLWREIANYGEQIIPGSKLFVLQGTSSNTYFYLLDDGDINRTISHLFDCLWTLIALMHLRKNRVVLHAAGVIRHEDAFLFLGPSGAGKSTASANSGSKGCATIHDDHLVLMKDGSGKIVVSDCAISVSPYPLRAVFFLHQDTIDYLVPVSQRDAAKKLHMACKESSAAPLLHGQYLQQVFSMTARVARVIPCYVLHLQNHSEFWNVIEAELGKN